jgi:predicted phage baseplate assembly protein
MTLQAPNLDDRRFQQLVDDAKRMVQQRCPEWTDHNVSDPGVTLIETFAFMVDQLVYRLNRVPDRNFITYLDLVGVNLFPPTAASTDVTFWLSAPLEETVVIPVGTEVATTSGGGAEPVTFTTVEHRDVVPSTLETVGSSVADGPLRNHDEELAGEREFTCFGDTPTAGDALYLGLTAAVPGCAVRFELGCDIEGVGVDPDHPPLIWEAWTGEGWAGCPVELDTTGGLNRDGEVVVHVPRDHVTHVIAKQRAGWIRCRIVDPYEGQPFYAGSPRVKRAAAATVGGTTEAVHAELVDDEILGLSEGVPGQRFEVRRSPIVPGDESEVVEVAAGDGWQQWTPVSSFAESAPDDLHFVIDRVGGQVAFGPAVRLADGSLRQYGAVPPKGAPLRLRHYRTGGGQAGNVASGAITVLESSIAYIDRVSNRLAASGGVDGETLANAKIRGPLTLRARGRAVTARDYELLAREAAPEVARVRCAPAGSDGDAAGGGGGVRVLVVPTVTEEEDRLRFEELLPHDETLERIAVHLDERRLIGARIMVEPPVYQGLTIVARLRARHRVSPLRLQADALDALYAYFHPTRGGPEGDGWPFGRPVHVGEVYSTLQRLPGVEFVEEATLFPADPVTGERSAPVQRLEISEHALVFGYQHSVLVEE